MSEQQKAEEAVDSDHCYVYIQNEIIVFGSSHGPEGRNQDWRQWHQETVWNMDWNRKWAKAMHWLLHLCVMPPSLDNEVCDQIQYNYQREKKDHVTTNQLAIISY